MLLPVVMDHDAEENDQSDVRRILSLDTSKSTGLHSPRGPRPVKHNSYKDSMQIRKSATEPTSGANESWTNSETVLSPTKDTISPSSQDGTLPRLEPVRQVSEPVRSSTSTNATSVTAARLWGNLRHHVLTPPVRQTARSGTPKGSRFPKLGLKHLVEEVATMQDSMRTFAEAILRACNIARYGEIQKSLREREASASSQSGNSSGRRLDYLRRPHSAASISVSTSPPSLRYLYQILVQYSTNIHVGQTPVQLPHESRILSSLLCPFLSHTNYPFSRLEEEQLTAMDAFELLSDNWTPTEEVRHCLNFFIVQMMIGFRSY